MRAAALRCEFAVAPLRRLCRRVKFHAAAASAIRSHQILIGEVDAGFADQRAGKVYARGGRVGIGFAVRRGNIFGSGNVIRGSFGRGIVCLDILRNFFGRGVVRHDVIRNLFGCGVLRFDVIHNLFGCGVLRFDVIHNLFGCGVFRHDVIRNFFGCGVLRRDILCNFFGTLR